MSFKEDLKEEAKEQGKAFAREQGAKVAARGFRKLMDHFAAKNPKGLVARVRRFLGGPLL
jgi:hypothetical protein